MVDTPRRMNTPMRILAINSMDRDGGAARVASDLHLGYLNRGHDARLVVGNLKGGLPGVRWIGEYETGRWRRFWRSAGRWVYGLPDFPGRGVLRRCAERVERPRGSLQRMRGREDSDHPSSHRLLDDPSWFPDIIHCHNLHGGFFDLEALEELSRACPLIVTMHDPWLLTGHCAHFVDCDRWLFGCGDCPDLERYPPLRRDGTSENWLHKKRIYERSDIFVVTPSGWLMDKVDGSMMRVVGKRIIPNGVDPKIFHPGDREGSRARLGLTGDAFVCLYASQFGARRTTYKDYDTVARAFGLLKDGQWGKEVILLCIGGKPSSGDDSRHERYVAHTSDLTRLADCYRAADVFLHASNAENLPLTLLEAQACGTPVVATDVGGVSEALEDKKTGFLVPRGDHKAMADRVEDLLLDEHLRSSMGMAAATRTEECFSLERQVDEYLDLYAELIRARKAAGSS